MVMLILRDFSNTDIDAVTDCGRSVFMLAAENGHKDVPVHCIKYAKRKTRSIIIPIALVRIKIKSLGKMHLMLIPAQKFLAHNP